MEREEKQSRFGSEVSKWIAGFYLVTLAFLILLLAVVPAQAEMDDLELLIFYIVFPVVILIFIYFLYKAYNMEFSIGEEKIEISGLIGKKNIEFSEVNSIEKTPIPFGFRLFGASFLGGKYYLPGIGKANVSMTNFTDGVLIKTKEGKNYVITPDRPFEFIEEVEKRV